MGNRLLACTAAGVVLSFLIGCGGSASNADQPQTSSPPTQTEPTQAPTPRGPAAADSCSTEASPDGQQSSMVDPHEFQPADLTISVGETVSWTNNSSNNHSVTFDNGPDCGYVLIGKSVSVQFNTPGTFTYEDRIFPQYLKGTITVNAQ